MDRTNYNNIPRTNLNYEYTLGGSGTDTAGSSDISFVNPIWINSEKLYTPEMVDLNGSSAYGTASHSYSGTFAICGWFKFDSFKSGESQIYRITGAGTTNIGFSHTGTGGTNTFQLFTNNGTVGSSVVLSSYTPVINKWYYIVAYGDGVNKGLIIKTEDGEEYTTSDTTAPSVTLSGTANIGRHPTVGGREYDGQISGLRIYNTITTQDIHNLYIEGQRLLGDSASYPELLKGTVAYYDFKGDSSNIIDGILSTSSGVTYTTDHLGRANSAAEFAGAGYVDIGSTSIVDVATDDYTFIVKFKADNIAANKFLIGKEHCRLRIDGTVEWAWFDGDTASYLNTSAISTGVWYTAIISVDQSVGHKLYLDGNLEDSNTETGNPTSSSNNFSIGALDAGTWANYFDGIISYGMILKRAVSTDEARIITTLLDNDYIYPFGKSSTLNLQDGLVMHLDSAGNDLSGSGNSGTPTAVTKVRRNQSEGGSYNGSTSKIAFTAPIIPIGAKHIGAKIKTTSSGVQYILGNARISSTVNGSFLWTNSGHIEFNIVDGTGTRTVSLVGTKLINDGNIHQIDVVWDGTTGADSAKLYIDGILDISQTPTKTTEPTAETNLSIGYSAVGTAYPFSGEIYEPKIHNRALSDKEIQSNNYLNYLN